MNLIKVTYIFFLGTGIAFASQPSVAKHLSPEAMVPGSSLFGKASEPPPLPLCGTCDTGTNFGPLIIADFLTIGCQNNPDGRIYYQQRVYKTKFLCANGYYWICTRTVVLDAICTTYSTTNCPEDTCKK